MKRHNDEKFGDALKSFINNSRLKPKLNQNKIELHWKEMMGPTIVGFTRSMYVRRKKLYITIDSAPLRQELSYGKDKIKNLLNEKLGEEYLDDVIIC